MVHVAIVLVGLALYRVVQSETKHDHERRTGGVGVDGSGGPSPL